MTAPGSEFSDEATALYTTAVTSYADSLEMLSKHCAVGHEVVLLHHVKDALSALGPTKGGSSFLDWIKRLAFLFGGVTITLGLQLLLGTAPPAHGETAVFVGFLVLSVVFFVTAINADVPWVRRHLFATR